MNLWKIEKKIHGAPKVALNQKRRILIFQKMQRFQRISGAPGRIRTRDPLITNQVLYQLSYKGSGDADSS